MARMLTLDPAPCADLGNGYTFLVPEAGRYGDGLRTTVHIHNGTLQHVDTVALASAPRRDAFAQQVVERTGLDPALVGQKLLELLSGVEGCVRECEARANQRSAQEGKQDSGGLFLQDPEPWDDPVDGADLIATLRGVIERFVVLPPGAAYTVALWVLHTYALDAAFTSPILYIRSPEKRCGKSTLMTLLVTLCLRALPASNISAASVYRAVEKWQPTLIIDEADTFLRHNEELAGIINAGHTRPLAYVIRTHPDTHEPERFSTWAPKAIAGIGRQRDTLEDRSIQISMRRKTKEEKVERLRLDQTGQFDEIKRMCVRWAMDHLDAIRNADPDVPDFLDDRAADNWRTLCAIAEVAAGDCLQQADDAIRKLYGESGQASDDPSSGVMLLQDLQEAFESRPHGRITLVL